MKFPPCTRAAGFFPPLAVLTLYATHSQAAVITVNNPGFSSGSGRIVNELTLLDGSSTIGPQQLGTTGWYGLANHTNLVVVVPVAGFRPGIEVNFDSSSAGVGELNYSVIGSLGGLAGLEMPEATLWQPLSLAMAPNTTYQLTATVTTNSFLDLSALSARGFGIGVTTGSSTTARGNFYANSLSTPSLLNLAVVSGATQQMTFTFTTGASVPTGNMGIAFFAGQGTQTIQLSLLTDYKVDNVAFATIPEPSTAMLLGALTFLPVVRRRRC